MRLKSWGSKAAIVGSFLLGLWLMGSVRVRTQAPFLVFGSSSGSSQVVQSTSNALWVSLQGGSVTTIPFTINGPALGVVSTDGLVIQNATAATVGTTVQISPRAKWCGTAYNSVSTLSETDCFFWETLPATVAGTTTALFKLGSTINGAAATYPMTVSNAGVVVAAGNISSSANVIGNNLFTASNHFNAAGDGEFKATTIGEAIGVTFKFDALPTVASGFGTSPSITAGSTPLAGSVNIGTGGVATSGIINFNGTAFPSAPFCVADGTTSNITTRVAAVSTTQLTLTTTVAWTASDVINWICISAK